MERENREIERKRERRSENERKEKKRRDNDAGVYILPKNLVFLFEN